MGWYILEGPDHHLYTFPCRFRHLAIQHELRPVTPSVEKPRMGYLSLGISVIISDEGLTSVQVNLAGYQAGQSNNRS